MSFDLQRLYELLPAVYRARDEEIAAQLRDLLDPAERAELQTLLQNFAHLGALEAARLRELQDQASTGPLRALLAILAEQVAVIEENLAQLYDDQFIETCAEWVVPYIGDLVGVRGLVTLTGGTFTQRAVVAHAIGNRRRKGTASALEQIARDVTGWSAHVVEYFRLLAWTQFMNHIRPENRAFPDMTFSTLALANTPFDELPRTADVRNIELGGGRPNIPSVGIWLWRIRNYPITNAPAFRVDAQRWKFDPLGRDLQLYNGRDNRVPIETFSTPVNVPLPIDRVIRAERPETYAPDSFSFTVDGQSEDFQICDLRDVGAGQWAHTPAAGKHGVDPQLGRIALTKNANEVRVNYQYGFSADIGGGEYARAGIAPERTTRLYSVPAPYATLNLALQAMIGDWTADPAGFDEGIVQIEVNDPFVEPLVLDIPEGKRVTIRALPEHRPLLDLTATARVTGDAESELQLDGLLIAGKPLRVPRFKLSGADNLLAAVRVAHCTLAPPPASADPVRLTIDRPTLALTIDRSIVGAIQITEDARATITNSIVDSGSESGEAYAGTFAGDAGAPLNIENSTVVGTVLTRILEYASNTIFAAASAGAPPVHAQQVQSGCVRFSYVPPGSRVPRRFMCQPSRAGVVPIFTSITFGDAAYGQLARNCAVEIRTGADDRSEMGVLHDLMQPQREASLRARIDEFLRFGLEAGIFYAS